ncbi:MAG TPA: hypothetical protein DCR35_14935 [Runella sp.]|nr:hypothetical protein [Runella sp.]HAO50476.1 hypothetical protein [Runella sp.]
MTMTAISNYEEWAIRVSRLLELIAMDNDAIKMHQEGSSPALIVEQYQRLRNDHLEELRELLKDLGMTIQLLNISNAA